VQVVDGKCPVHVVQKPDLEERGGQDAGVTDPLCREFYVDRVADAGVTRGVADPP
jgi:hypothetical protein